ncbi:MAG: hypothetical protein QCI38_06595 [Candidatus Thermoplasmatota archaeon]|nr:hypothetical protein [Candidatus Thermoplasmatota archaeon]
MKMPCEIVIWHILPAIRRELVNQLLEEGNITQSQAAKLMDLTPAAISQYRSSKRAKESIDDEEAMAQIQAAAKRLVSDPEADVSKEICNLCILIRKRGVMSHLFEKGAAITCLEE